MKKKLFLFKLLLLTLTLTMLLTPAVSAASEKTWDTDMDSYLSDGSESYERIELPLGFSIDPFNTYYFHVETGRFTNYIAAPSEDTKLFWFPQNKTFLFVNAETKAQVQDFFDGNFSYATLEISSRLPEYTPLSTDTLAAIEAYADTHTSVTVDVGKLSGAPKYVIAVYDKTRSLRHSHAMIFLLDGHYYFVNLDNLGNQYFDADGNLSYRRGQLEVTDLGEANAQIIQSLISDRKQKICDIEYESDNDPDDIDDESISKVMFWIHFGFYGGVLPLIALIIGLVLGKKAKLRQPKLWYVLSITAGLWILAAVGLMLLFIL